jgi:hypothetical protein
LCGFAGQILLPIYQRFLAVIDDAEADWCGLERRSLNHYLPEPPDLRAQFF